MHDTLTNLSELLRELPGIGPRQARRLAFWFVRRNKNWVHNFSKALVDARAGVMSCRTCMRLYPTSEGSGDTCGICQKSDRDIHTLLIVEKDVDLENIERTGTYHGRYFVLGGTAGPLDKEPEKKVRIRELLQYLNPKDLPITEIIFALSATTEGEDTELLLEEHLGEVIEKHGITLSKLGRGLSTGTELEYVDTSTMKSALSGRQ